MGRKSKFSKEQKIEICKRYLDGSESISMLAEEINAGKSTIKRWIKIFKAYGDSAFDEKTANESYTKEFKRKVVEAYLAGEGSLIDIALKYNIPSDRTVLAWVKLYNDHIELKDYIPGGKEIYMAKCRKVTKEERIETIIAYNYPSIALNKLVTFCKKNGIKSIADVTEWYDIKGFLIRSIIKRWDVKFRMTKVHPKMNGIIAISQYLYDYYRDKTHTIKLPPLVDLTDKKWDVEKIKNMLPTFVYAGSPSAQKEKLDLIVNTIEDIAKEKPILLKVIGVTKSQYENMYSIKYNGNAVKFYGRIPHEEAIREVALSDWSIIIRENTLSNKAGFPTKFVESISCGTPVIANRFSNIDEYVHNENGLILNQANIKEKISECCCNTIKTDKKIFSYEAYCLEISDFICRV